MRRAHQVPLSRQALAGPTGARALKWCSGGAICWTNSSRPADPRNRVAGGVRLAVSPHAGDRCDLAIPPRVWGQKPGPQIGPQRSPERPPICPERLRTCRN